MSRMYKFYAETITLGKYFTVKHYMKEKLSQRTIYDIFKRLEKVCLFHVNMVLKETQKF